jgi:hypothetical protein
LREEGWSVLLRTLGFPGSSANWATGNVSEEALLEALLELRARGGEDWWSNTSENDSSVGDPRWELSWWLRI